MAKKTKKNTSKEVTILKELIESINSITADIENLSKLIGVKASK